jgi:hypothetical protein
MRNPIRTGNQPWLAPLPIDKENRPPLMGADHLSGQTQRLGDSQAGCEEEFDQETISGLMPARDGSHHPQHFITGEIGNDAESFSEGTLTWD